jgi:hypothetical protein
MILWIAIINSRKPKTAGNGSVTCTITRQGGSPPPPSEAWQWALTTGPDTGWHNSGDVITGIPAGTYTMTFGPGFYPWDLQPSDIPCVVTAGNLTSKSVEYLYNG